MVLDAAPGPRPGPWCRCRRRQEKAETQGAVVHHRGGLLFGHGPPPCSLAAVGHGQAGGRAAGHEHVHEVGGVVGRVHPEDLVAVWASGPRNGPGPRPRPRPGPRHRPVCPGGNGQWPPPRRRRPRTPGTRSRRRIADSVRPRPGPGTRYSPRSTASKSRRRTLGWRWAMRWRGSRGRSSEMARCSPTPWEVSGPALARGEGSAGEMAEAMRPAARRPAAMAWTTVEGPLTASPAANTPGQSRWPGSGPRPNGRPGPSSTSSPSGLHWSRSVPLADGHDHCVRLDASVSIAVKHNARRSGPGQAPNGPGAGHLGDGALRRLSSTGA